MKTVFKTLGIIAMAAIIGFGMAACGDGGGGGNGESGDPAGGGGDTCSSCGKNDWGNWETQTAATCFNQAVQVRYCNDCANDQTRNAGTALEHTPSTWQIKTAVTETINGIEHQICTRAGCNHELDTRIAAYATGTTGLAFSFHNTWGGVYYVMAGTVNNSSVHIPAYHRPNASSEYQPVSFLGDINAGSADRHLGAFVDKNITSVTFAAEIEGFQILNHAFAGCTGLASITFPARVFLLADTFIECTNLTSVTFIDDASNDNQIAVNAFLGDLRTKYLAGGAGTYTTTAPVGNSSVWTKQ